MRTFLLLLLIFHCFCFSAYADDESQKVQDQLNAIYVDDEQVYNEANARGRLISEGLKASKAVLDRIVPEIDNLLFKMKGLLEPSLEIRRQAGLAAKYQNDFGQIIKLVQGHYESIEPQVKETCEQIEKWKKRSGGEEKRADLVDKSRQVLQTVIFRQQKMQEELDLAGKTLNKISALRDQAATFSSNFEGLVRRANALSAPEQQARQGWQAEQKELGVIPLRIKTLDALSVKGKALLKEIQALSPSKDEQQKSVEQTEVIESRYRNLQELNQQLVELSQQVEEKLTRFDTTAKAFKELGVQIITPFQNGLQSSLENYVRDTQARLVEVTLLKDRSLVEINRLRTCMGQIENESDTVIIPEVKGLSFEEASELLRQMNLRPDRKGGEPAPQRNLSGRVYEQTPAPEQKALPGSNVTIRVYGTYTPLVPDLVGKSVDEANAELVKLGLQGAAKMGEAAPDKEVEDEIYSQMPRAYSTAEDGSTVEFTYYGKVPLDETEQKFSSTPFYVLCRLYVPKLKPNAPSKGALTISNVDFVQREAPFVFAFQERALDRYSLSFFEPNRAISTFIQIVGREVKTGLSSQYDGALLLEVVDVFKNLDDLKQKSGGLIDFSQPDPLSFLVLTEGSGLFMGAGVNGDVQLTWKGGPIISGWSGRMKEASFSLFRQLL